MAAYLLTIHAYRSWSEDNPRGYVQRGRPGVQLPQPRLAEYRAGIATHPPVRFDCGQMRVAVDTVREVCVALDERPIAASCTSTHLHVLVEMGSGGRGGWSGEAPPLRDGARGDGARGDGAQGDGARGDGARGDGAQGDGARGDGGKAISADALCARIKSIVGWKLSAGLGTKGNRWFSRGQDVTPVKDDAHLQYLVTTYLPKHETHEGGVFARWD